MYNCQGSMLLLSSSYSNSGKIGNSFAGCNVISQLDDDSGKIDERF
jgi:hypothetical protein